MSFCVDNHTYTNIPLDYDKDSVYFLTFKTQMILEIIMNNTNT